MFQRLTLQSDLLPSSDEAVGREQKMRGRGMVQKLRPFSFAVHSHEAGFVKEVQGVQIRETQNVSAS
jgi:hypothetical protein